MTAEPETLFCANHPQTPTALRCNRCGKLICAKCATRTPVGYRCRQCVTTQQQIFETAVWYDYVLAVVCSAPLAAIAGFLVTQLTFFAIFLAPVVGGVVAEVVRFAVRRRRGRYLSLVAAGGFALGSAVLFLLPFLSLLLGFFFANRGGSFIGASGSFFNLIWVAAYAVLGASTVYARLRGISINN